MDYVRLGRTGLDVSVACLGTGGASKLGQTRGASAAQSVGLIQRALDIGVTAIDTAAGYGTEEIVGAAVRGRRDRVVISTKAAITQRQRAPGGEVVSGARYGEYIEGCLRRLGTDYVDIMYVHGLNVDRYEYCIEQIVPVLDRFRRQGKIRFIGVSEGWGGDPRHVMLERALADDAFDVLMVGLNVVNHSALERVLPVARQRDLGVQCMYAVRGKLAHPQGARQLVDDAVAAGEVDPDEVDPTDPLGFLLQPGVAGSLPEACYRFARHAPGVHTVLTGTGSATHLAQNVRSINGPPLPEGTLAHIGRLFGKVCSVTGD